MSDEIQQSNTETALVTTQPVDLSLPISTLLPVDIIAENPEEMRHGQHTLIDWIKLKLESVKQEVVAANSEADELKVAYDYAVKQKWKKDTILKHHGLALKRVSDTEKRVAYYEKILAALEAGYYIVPPMGMELFAIRTDRSKPTPKRDYLTWQGGKNFVQDAKNLPAGEGDYQNPHPSVLNNPHSEFKDDQGRVKRTYWADHWQAIDFPVNMLKPRIMEATSRAMALKIFDELGVLPQDQKRNPDPVIMGRIYEPKRHAFHTAKVITFMIAWHLNTKDL